MSRTSWITASLLLASLMACDERTARHPPDPHTDATRPELSSRRVRTNPDLERLDYEKQIPGFGGFYLRRTIMHVVLTDTTQIERARDVLLPRLEVLRRRGSIPEVDPARAGRAQIVAQQGRYPFSQLYAWKNIAVRSGLGRGLRGVGVSVQENKVSVMLADPATAPQMVELLTGLGIPEDAISIW